MVQWSAQSSSKKLNPRIEKDTEDGRDSYRDSNGAWAGRGQPGKDWLGGAQDDETDFGRDAQAYWGADGAEAAIHVDMRHGR